MKYDFEITLYVQDGCLENLEKIIEEFKFVDSDEDDQVDVFGQYVK